MHLDWAETERVARLMSDPDQVISIDWAETERVARLMTAGELYYAESEAIKAAKHFDQFAGNPLGELGGYYHDQASVYRSVRREKEGR